jgi:hypothetical protein
VVRCQLTVAQIVQTVQVDLSPGFAGLVQAERRITAPAIEYFLHEFPSPAGTVTGPTIFMIRLIGRG